MTQPDHDRHIDYVEFAATDIAGTKQFYAAVFGWRFEDYGPDYTSFQDGRLAGGFTRGQPAPPGGPLVVIYGRHLEELETKVKQAGGNICGSRSPSPAAAASTSATRAATNSPSGRTTERMRRFAARAPGLGPRRRRGARPPRPHARRLVPEVAQIKGLADVV